MSEPNSIPEAARSKPAKPYPEFPLTAHPAGYWCKKIRGKIHYFSPWADPDAALTKYLEQKDDLHAGRTPRPDTEGLTIKGLVKALLNHKKERVDHGELSPQTWTGYKNACDAVVAAFSKQRLVSDIRPGDFGTLRSRMAMTWGPHHLGTAIQCVRCLFKFGYDAEMVPTPVRFGPGFKRPSKKTLRIHRAKQGTKLFSAHEIRRLLAAAGRPLKAMMLLGINGGLGNADCGNLPLNEERPHQSLGYRAPAAMYWSGRGVAVRGHSFSPGPPSAPGEGRAGRKRMPGGAGQRGGTDFSYQ